jgi:hypothetical protein
MAARKRPTALGSAGGNRGLSQRVIAPVLLVDVGNVFGSGVGDPLVGAGVGLSVGNGWLRSDLVNGLNQSFGWMWGAGSEVVSETATGPHAAPQSRAQSARSAGVRA